ncbi:MAG: TIGR03986 family CRISPR-associated RAMP protein [Marinospirillum sp.]|uniref:TIGR03986 family type III CRISPR-associated RAMP protein n=1 Tax=Marinospirillum sp. TaxID=2183934 RepID=UPI0019EE4D52|nr:TIGR03986 family CRISPR-associated RAMP protein [Marinospirillum sp.]MBE0507878.1 TIGR03986 family CRISPR-associated RAMP protein [Marinospirillum sp.]
MTDLMTPYRFIPLSHYIFRPDWAKLVSHDHPFADGVSGELSVSITTKTRLCVGGKQEKPSDKHPGKVFFYRTPDNHLAIPGTSIKGMLRNVMEIACFGHFRQVEDQQLGVRDISRGKNFYSEAMNRSPVFTGWLRFDQGHWNILPCNYARIYQGDLINHFKIDKANWNRNKLAKERYGLLNGLRDISFDIDTTYKYDCKKLATNLGKGKTQGYVVVTGQPGPAFDQSKHSKKRDFVFYETQSENKLTVSNRVVSGFMRIHEESEEWKYWRKQLSALKYGVPVFFHKNAQGEVKSLGLSRMYRLPYEYSLHDAITHTRPEHLESDHPDLPGLIFGWLDEQETSGHNNLRGRVMPGLFELTHEASTRWEEPTVLSGPKPTFYPAYIHQTNDRGHYKTLMDKDAKLAGWKRYPAKEHAELSKLQPKVADNKKVQVLMETLPENCIFQGKIRFHNLRLVELGALLWVIDFGQRDLNHGLGLGKPYGFGQIRLECQSTRLQPNASHLHSMSNELLMQTARVSFKHYMDRVWQQVTNTETFWEESSQVVSLLNSLDPTYFKDQALEYYPEPKAFMTAKQEESRLTSLSSSGLADPGPKANLVYSPIELNTDTLSHMAQENLAALTAKKEQQAQKEVREAEKANMSDEERELAELEDCYLQAEAQLTSTLENKLAKTCNQLYVTSASWEKELQNKAGQLGKKVFNLAQREGKENNKLGKAAKKLKSYLE